MRFLSCATSFQSAMPRIKTESLQEGMVVSRDVTNIDNMLLLPNGCKLTARHIGILQAWGVAEIDIQASGAGDDTDPVAKLSPEKLTKLTEELRAQFWKPDDADPVFAEVFKLMLKRNAGRPAAK